jgi:tripartite-type tricarboxylate transporter receptor subunit TctC
MIHQVALAAGMTMYKNLTFDAEKDFVTIGLINNAASTWAARAESAAEQHAELVRWMKEPGTELQGRACRRRLVRPSGRRAGRAGTRRDGHAGPLSRRRPALNDLLSGEVDLSSQSAVQAGPLIKAGKLKAYAIIGRSRFAGLPELPTMGELGHKKLDLDFWHMLLAPAGTPRPIIDRLNAALRQALADPRVMKTFSDGGMDLFPPAQGTPEAAAALLKSDLKLWGDVIRANNIQAAQ